MFFFVFFFAKNGGVFFRSRHGQFWFSSWVCWDQLRPPGGLSLCWFDGKLQWDLDGYSSRNGDSRHVGIWSKKKEHSLAGKNMQIWRTLLGGCVFLKGNMSIAPARVMCFFVISKSHFIQLASLPFSGWASSQVLHGLSFRLRHCHLHLPYRIVSGIMS